MGTRSVYLRIHKLDVMNDDTSDSSVVGGIPAYDAKYEDINKLTAILVNQLLKHGLISTENLIQQRCLDSDNQTVKLKLHITLINTKFGRQQKFKMNKKLLVDFSRLVNDFKHFSFGSVSVKEIHLSSLNEYDRQTDASKIVTKICLP